MVLARILAVSSETPAAWDDYWYEQRGMMAASGIRITPDVALRISAVYRCVKLLAETMGALPLIVYRRLPDDAKQRATNHPLAETLEQRPNAWQTAFEFREMMMGHVLLRGNAFAEIIPRPGNPAMIDLLPLHPDRVRMERLADGRPRYLVRDSASSSEERKVLDEDMFHLRGFSSDGLRGLSLTSLASDTFGSALAMERYSGNLFRHGARPSSAITHPKTLSPQARTNLRQAIDDNHTGAENQGRPILLEEGMTWQQMGMTNTDAEFLASRNFTIAEIGRWFGIPLHKIMQLERSTNNNIEHQALEYVIDAVLPWAKRWEQCITRDLILAPQTFFAEFLLAGLLRGDTKSRFESYAQGRQWGWLSANDVRRFENMNPIDGGDSYMVPLNMMPASGAAAGVTPAAPTAMSGQLRLLAGDAASRVVRKEISAMQRLAEKTAGDEAAWGAGVEAFYAEHAAFVAATLRIPDHDAVQYARSQRDELLALGPTVLGSWETERTAQLAAMAANQEVTAA